jgi:hypothetical protein
MMEFIQLKFVLIVSPSNIFSSIWSVGRGHDDQIPLWAEKLWISLVGLRKDQHGVVAVRNLIHFVEHNSSNVLSVRL